MLRSRAPHGGYVLTVIAGLILVMLSTVAAYSKQSFVPSKHGALKHRSLQLGNDPLPEVSVDLFESPDTNEKIIFFPEETLSFPLFNILLLLVLYGALALYAQYSSVFISKRSYDALWQKNKDSL